MKPFHPLTFWGCLTALAIGVVASNSVLCALIALGGSAFIVARFRDDGPWRNSFKWAIFGGLSLLAIRAITATFIGVPRIGHTIFTLPRVNLPSWLPGIRIGGDVTWERLSSSLHEGLIIATVIVLFGAANSVTSPHKLLRVLPTQIFQIGVTLTIATSVFPQLISSITRIREAQYLRSGVKPRLTKIAIPLLEESLGRAVNLAESMEARGFGQSKHHSRYRPISFQKRDLAFIASGVFTAVGMVAL